MEKVTNLAAIRDIGSGSEIVMPSQDLFFKPDCGGWSVQLGELAGRPWEELRGVWLYERGLLKIKAEECLGTVYNEGSALSIMIENYMHPIPQSNLLYGLTGSEQSVLLTSEDRQSLGPGYRLYNQFNLPQSYNVLLAPDVVEAHCFVPVSRLLESRFIKNPELRKVWVLGNQIRITPDGRFTQLLTPREQLLLNTVLHGEGSMVSSYDILLLYGLTVEKIADLEYQDEPLNIINVNKCRLLRKLRDLIPDFKIKTKKMLDRDTYPLEYFGSQFMTGLRNSGMMAVMSTPHTQR